LIVSVINEVGKRIGKGVDTDVNGVSSRATLRTAHL